MIQLNFAHICDLAFFSKDEKLNIIGLFKNISTSQFPFFQPKITFVINLTTDEMKGFKAQILKKETGEVLQKIEALPQNFKKLEKTTEINFINEFVNTKFEEAGDYFLEVWFGNKVITKVPFLVSLIKPPNKK